MASLSVLAPRASSSPPPPVAKIAIIYSAKLGVCVISGATAAAFAKAMKLLIQRSSESLGTFRSTFSPIGAFRAESIVRYYE